MRRAALPIFSVMSSAVVSLTALASPALANYPPVTKIETVASFVEANGEAPEDVYSDHEGNLFVSLALKGEVLRIDRDGTQSSYAQFPLGQQFSFCSGFYALLGPITFDLHGNLYASVGSCDPQYRGVWKVAKDGTTTQLVQLPFESFPNGIVLHRNKLLVADSNLGLIWSVDPHDDVDHGAEADVWVSDPLLTRLTPGQGFPGANGIQIYGNTLYVAATDRSGIVKVPIKPNGRAGTPYHFVDTPVGCDDFAFDLFGSIYCASFFDQVLRIRPDGTQEVLISGGTLDGPTSVAFGRTWNDFLDIYVSNASFLGFSGKHTPSIERYRVGVIGAPVLGYLPPVTRVRSGDDSPERSVSPGQAPRGHGGVPFDTGTF